MRLLIGGFRNARTTKTNRMTTTDITSLKYVTVVTVLYGSKQTLGGKDYESDEGFDELVDFSGINRRFRRGCDGTTV